jgi:hypothetical protein
MISLKKIIKEFQLINKIGKKIIKDPYFIKTKEISLKELSKNPSRTTIINFLLQLTSSENYLEIGVRNPNDNFSHINCTNKYSVDPGLEFKKNPVDFKLTSDEFFEKLEGNKLQQFKKDIKFDVIFIDGLHTSGQVEKDIQNSLKYIKDSGFIILHDCNPPTEFHQRENYLFRNSPAGGFWNGTTWKAFYKYRHLKGLYSVCFDTDWGVGVISKSEYPQLNRIQDSIANEYFEYSLLDENRKEYLNLQLFEEWKNNLKK